MHDARHFGLGERLAFTLFLGYIGIRLSVVVDVDHILAIVWNCGWPLTILKLFACPSGRPLHLPAIVISGCVFLLCLALYTGLLFRTVVSYNG